MSQQLPEEPAEPTKQALRRAAYDARRRVVGKDERSRRALLRLTNLSSYQRATTVLWYVDCRSELRTQWFLPQALSDAKRVAVPYCTTDERGHPTLGLWRLKDVGELVEGKWKILTPPPDRWQEPDRTVAASDLDCVIVPGVAFSRDGRRLGNGQGYYDRLLADVSHDCVRVGICYEPQLFVDLPQAPHDAGMDFVVTESQVYRGRPR